MTHPQSQRQTGGGQGTSLRGCSAPHACPSALCWFSHSPRPHLPQHWPPAPRERPPQPLELAGCVWTQSAPRRDVCGPLAHTAECDDHPPSLVP